MEDMAEYATLSAKRRKEEIAAGADIALAVRSTRSLTDLLRRLDCVPNTNTLSEAIGSAVDFLTPSCVNECFYICKERNRIVHETNAKDELRDVQRFRSAIRRATNDIHDLVDIQESYKAAHLNAGVDLFYRGKYDSAVSILKSYVDEVDGKFYPEQLAKARKFIALSKSRQLELQKADEAFKRAKARGMKNDILSSYNSYLETSTTLLVEEDCYSLVMTRLGFLTKPEPSIKYNTKALEKDPNNPTALHSRAKAYMKLDDFKSAKADLEKVVKSGKILDGVTADLEKCKQKTDPLYKQGHLQDDEIDQLMAQFGLED
jgi:tetratricopeptide (TPR) repeat protein